MKLLQEEDLRNGGGKRNNNYDQIIRPGKVICIKTCRFAQKAWKKFSIREIQIEI